MTDDKQGRKCPKCGNSTEAIEGIIDGTTDYYCQVCDACIGEIPYEEKVSE